MRTSPKPRWKSFLAVLAVSVSSLGCLRFPDAVAYEALDYKLDRERVLAVRFNPPVLAHGLPVRMEALVVGPSAVEGVRADVCGLRDDVPSMVQDGSCFQNPEIVADIGDVPGDWDPPDLSTVTCPPADTGFTGTDQPPPDTGPDDDTDSDTGSGPAWFAGDCASVVPIRVTAQTADGPVYGLFEASVRKDPYVEGEYVPPSYADVAHTLTVTGSPVAGGNVGLRFEIAGRPDALGFRWFVTDGELRKTGRTDAYDDGDVWWTENTLTIPDGFHGALDVYVVARSADDEATNTGVTGDVAWDHVALEVP